MALISCTDCNKQISDSAAACPACGAPVPKALDPDQEACPFCLTAVHGHAVTCPGCRAMKGYMYEPRYGVFGRTASIIWGIIVPAITVIGIPVSIYAAYRVFVTGPRWFQTRHS